MPSSVRLLLGGAVGLVVTWLLATGAAAQPSTPGYRETATAQAIASQTATRTPTGAATATGTTTPAVAAVAPNSATIMGGRGRVANVRDRGFTVLWTTEADTVGQVNYGPAATLGSTATDQRGPAFAGRTHYVEIGGLAPNTTYFFDVVSGGVVDNNAGQHYQIRTGPEISGSPPLGNSLVGDVRQPGGVAPAGGALVWLVVKDANNQGSLNTSQLLGGLAGADGRFQIGLQPRTTDLAAYFVYQTEGDLIEASARHESGSLDNMGLNTAITQGGTTPNNAQLVLTATSSAAAATPTAVNTPVGVATTPVPTVVPPPSPVAAPIAPTPNLSVPVQLPALKEMALDQYPAPGQPSAPIVMTSVPAKPGGYPGPAAQPQPPAATKPAPVVGATAPPAAQPAAPQPVPFAVATPLPTAAVGAVPAPAVQPAPAQGFGPPPAVQPGATVPPPKPPAGSFSQGVPRDTTVPQQSTGPAAAPVAPAPAPLATLANLPPVVSALFYGGITIVAIGGGLAVWSVLNGTGWRPR